MTTNFYTVKGGQGATTLAAAAAVRSAQLLDRPIIVVVDDQDELEDFAAALGAAPPMWDGVLSVDIGVKGRFEAYTREAAMCADLIEPDYTVGHEWRPGTNNVLVTRACYLALRRAARRNDDKPDLVVFIPEPGRALGKADIELALGATVIEAPWDPAVSRAVDAGMLLYKQPATLERTLDEISKHPARY